MIIGHSVSTADGIILAIDEPVAHILQRTQKQLVGISYMSITHIEDLARNVTGIAALQPNGGTMRIRKRYVAGEGGTVALDVEVSRLGALDTGYLVGTLSTIDPTEPSTRASSNQLAPAGLSCASSAHTNFDRNPLRLWQRANELLEMSRARDALLGADLCADHAWTMLLLIYVAEAESRIVTVATIIDVLHLPHSMVDRWIRVLQAKLLLDPLSAGIGALQLTQVGIDRVERLLAEHVAAKVS